MDTELSAEALVLVGLITILVQQLKFIPFLVKLKGKFPIFVAAAIALGIGAAYMQVMPNPVFAGVLMGLMSAGVYSGVKNGKK